MKCELIEVIRSYGTRGRGTEADPYRTVVQFWSKDGEMLAENDPCRVEGNEQTATPKEQA